MYVPVFNLSPSAECIRNCLEKLCSYASGIECVHPASMISSFSGTVSLPPSLCIFQELCQCAC